MWLIQVCSNTLFETVGSLLKQTLSFIFSKSPTAIKQATTCQDMQLRNHKQCVQENFVVISIEDWSDLGCYAMFIVKYRRFE